MLDVSRPNAGAIAALIEITGDPKRVVTISNHDEARRQGNVPLATASWVCPACP